MTTCNHVRPRLAALRKLLSRREVDALLVSGPENRRYLSGFTADDPDWGVLLITAAGGGAPHRLSLPDSGPSRKPRDFKIVHLQG